MYDQIIIFSNYMIAVLDFAVIIYCVFYFLRKQERTIYRKKRYYVLGAFLAGAAVTWLNTTRNNLIIGIGFVWITAVTGYLLFHKGKMQVFYSILFAVIFMGVQIVVINLVGLAVLGLSLNLTRKNFGVLYSDTLMLIKQMAELVVTRAAAVFFSRRRIRGMQWKLFLSYLVLPVLSIIFMLSLVSYSMMFQTPKTFFVIAVNMVLLVFMNLYITYIFEKLERSKELEREVSLYEQQAKMQLRYYEEIEEKYQGSRKIIHDMRNHLLTLEELCQQEQAAGYMKDLHAMLNELGQKYYTANRVLNIVLNDKEKLANAAGIHTDFTVHDEDLSFMRDVDLTIFLGNLLDNAIEAARLSSGKTIRLRIDRFHQQAAVRIENTANTEPKLQNGAFISKKDGGEGIGLLNVKRVVLSCHGILTADFKDNWFLVTVTFPLEKEEEV